MKDRRRQAGAFAERLRAVIAELKDMKPDEVHIISVRANYGSYQIIIGPESNVGRHVHSRPVEINGRIHHLVVSPERITPNPTHHQVKNNMKDTVIMREISVHLIDEEGDGNHLSEGDGFKRAVEAREFINLAGDKGKEMVERASSSGELGKAAYQIIQDDIMRALEQNPEDSIEEVT